TRRRLKIATVRSEVSVSEPVLYVAFELAKRQWKLAMTSGFGDRAERQQRGLDGDRAPVCGGASTIRAGGRRGGGQLLCSGGPRVLDSSRLDGARDRQPRGRLVESRVQAAPAADENRSDRCADAGAAAGAGVRGGIRRLERSARADAGRGSGASRES